MESTNGAEVVDVTRKKREGLRTVGGAINRLNTGSMKKCNHPQKSPRRGRHIGRRKRKKVAAPRLSKGGPLGKKGGGSIKGSGGALKKKLMGRNRWEERVSEFYPALKGIKKEKKKPMVGEIQGGGRGEFWWV